MLHVCSGDNGLAQWSATGLPGEAAVCRDSPAVGPWSPDPAARARLRSAWWGQDGPHAWAREEAALRAALGRADTTVLWFTPEPWDQLALLWVVAGLAGPEALLEPVPLGACGGAPAAELRAAFGDRRPLTVRARQEVASLWQLFQAEDWPALQAWVAQGGAPEGLPHLLPALARVLEDRPPHRPGRTERQVRDLQAAGVRDLAGMMRALAGLELPYGVAWYGDLLVGRLMARR
jgi:hypothetical protein